MVVLSNALINPGQEWDTYLTIEGVGDTSGLWYFCTRVPECVAGNAQWRPWLVTYPQLLSERVDPLGGLPESGELAVTILDKGRALTDQFRYFARPVDALDGDLTAAGTVFAVAGDGLKVPAGSLMYVGNECILVNTKSSDQTITNCTRGFLDTDAWAHRNRDSVYQNSFYYLGRRVRLYLIPHNADSLGEAYALPIYHCTALDMDETLNGYALRADTELSWLTRQVPRATSEVTINATYSNPDIVNLAANPDPSLSPWPDSPNYRAVRFGDQILRLEKINGVNNTWEWGWFVRGTSTPLGSTGNTGIGALQVGNTGQVVMSADPAGAGSFRKSTTGSTDRSTGWEITTNPIDILLCIILSSNHEDDGLELVNQSGGTNYSSLPVGWGLGVPVDKVDLASFDSARTRFAELQFEDYYYGDTPQPFAKMLVDNFLKPLGAFITTSNGKLRLVVPRIPADGGDTTDLTYADILVKPSAFGSPGTMLLPGIKFAVDSSFVASSVSFTARCLDGSPRTFGIDSSEYGETLGQRGYYGTAERPINIPFIGFRAPRAGTPPLIRDMLYRRLFRFQRPLVRLTFTTKIRYIDLGPGDIISLTLPELPDARLGIRDWTSVRCEITEKTPRVDADGVCIDWVVLTYGPNMRVAWVTPTARILSVATNTATVMHNRYTLADAPDGLPVTDAGAFRAGDSVRLCNLNCSYASPDSESIVSISSDDIELSGDFSGALAAGLLIVYDDYDNQSTNNKTDFAFESDRSSRTPGASSDEPYIYGES